MSQASVLTGRLETVLLDLADRTATGCLHVRDEHGDEAEVFLRDGLVYAVSVPGRRMMLGARLLSSGALSPEALAEALEIQRTELQGWRLGELLVHLGYTDRAVVEAYVVEQLKDGVTALLGWPVSKWRFRTGRKTRQDVAPPIEVESLLREIAHRLTTWADLAAVVGGPRAVPRLSTRSAADPEVVLGPNDWALLCKIDGERSINALATDCGFTLFEAGSVVAHLVESALVDVDASDPSTAELPTQPTLEDIDVQETLDRVSQALNRAALAEAEAAQAEREKIERVEAERVDAERAETERLEAEQAEAERAEAERILAERAEAERAEAERLEADRIAVEAERIAAERAEADRIAAEAERIAAERAEAQSLEADRIAAEVAAAERAETEHAETERIAAEVAAAERIAAERAEAERIEAELAAAERAEAERIEAEVADAERVEAERTEAERAETASSESDRAVAQRAQTARQDSERRSAVMAKDADDLLTALSARTDSVAPDHVAPSTEWETDRLVRQSARWAGLQDATAGEQPSAPPNGAADVVEAPIARSWEQEFQLSPAAMLRDLMLNGSVDPTPPAIEEPAVPRPAREQSPRQSSWGGSAFSGANGSADADTASLLRELSSLGVEDSSEATATARPTANAAAWQSSRQKRRGLFGRN